MCVSGSWRPNKDCNILTPLLWPSALCLFRSPDSQPEAWGLSFLLSAGFLYHILSPTGLQNYWGPRGPLWPGVAFPTTSYLQLLWTPTVWLPVLTELYNNSTPTQSPTQSLEWHVWSSSSEITVMQFTGHSLPVHQSMSVPCDFLPCPISSAKPAYAISSHNCHWNVSLPSGASPWSGKFGRVEGQNTTCVCVCVCMCVLSISSDE